MEVSVIIAGIDDLIAKLQRARGILGTELPHEVGKTHRGRPKGSKNADATQEPLPTADKVTAKKHKVSPEGRKRIADATRRRWAELRKTAGQ